MWAASMDDPRDELQREHEDGDADGLGGCRGIVMACLLSIAAVLVLSLLLRPQF